MSKVSVIGIIGYSVFMYVDSLPKEGETVKADDILTEAGGKGFNQALTLSRFNVEVSFLAAVGSDGYYPQFCDLCDMEGIKPFLVEKQGLTAYAVIHIDRQGKNFVSVCPGVTLEDKDIDLFEEEIKSSDYLLVTNEIPYDVLKKSILLADKYGVKIILNPAPYREIESGLKEKIFLFTPNEHETKGLEDIDRLVITLGEKGCYIKSLDMVISPVLVNAIDTTGAGDTFNGALTAMLCQGKDLITATQIANNAAALSTTRRGAATSVPYIDELKNKHFK